jgi:hypothetical protein
MIKPFAYIPALLLSIALLPVSLLAQDPKEQLAAFQKRFKDDNYGSTYHEQVFTFDTDKGDFGQPVVTAVETGEAQFLSLKKKAVFQHYDFFNQFVQFKSFVRYDKTDRSYVATSKKPYIRTVTDDNIFFDDSKVAFHTFNFTSIGQRGKTTWEKEFRDAKYLTRVFFHESFPQSERVIEFRVPDWMTVEIREMNFEGFKVEKTKEQKSGKTIYRYVAKLLDAHKREPNAIGFAHAYPHLILQIKKFEVKGTTVNGFQNTQDLYNWYNLLYKKCTNDLTALKPIVKKLTEGKPNDEEKIKSIYYWVQDNIRYIAFEDGYAGFIPSKANEVLTNTYGDCKGMANLLTEMLKLAGYDAYYSWIGTRAIPYPDHSLPAMCIDNHAITVLNFKGNTYFLDATEKYAAFGENAHRIQGKSALIGKGDAYEEKQVPVSGASDNVVKTRAALTLSGDKIKGHVMVTFTGNMRTDFHQYYQELPRIRQEENLKDLLQFRNDNIESSNIKTSNLKNREIPVVIEGDIDMSNTITAIGAEQYIGFDIFPKSLGGYAPDSNRVSGYDFEGILTYDDEIELTLPATHRCTDLPEKLSVETAWYSILSSYEVKGNKVILKKLFSFKKGMLPASALPEWRKALEQLRNFNSYVINILKK